MKDYQMTKKTLRKPVNKNITPTGRVLLDFDNYCITISAVCDDTNTEYDVSELLNYATMQTNNDRKEALLAIANKIKKDAEQIETLSKQLKHVTNKLKAANAQINSISTSN